MPIILYKQTTSDDCIKNIYKGYEYIMTVKKDISTNEVISVSVKPDPDTKRYPSFMYPDIEYYAQKFIITLNTLSTIMIDEDKCDILKSTITGAISFIKEANTMLL